MEPLKCKGGKGLGFRAYTHSDLSDSITFSGVKPVRVLELLIGSFGWSHPTVSISRKLKVKKDPWL